MINVSEKLHIQLKSVKNVINDPRRKRNVNSWFSVRQLDQNTHHTEVYTMCATSVMFIVMLENIYLGYEMLVVEYLNKCGKVSVSLFSVLYSIYLFIYLSSLLLVYFRVCLFICLFVHFFVSLFPWLIWSFYMRLFRNLHRFALPQERVF